MRRDLGFLPKIVKIAIARSVPLTSGTKILTSAGGGRYSCRNIDACYLNLCFGWVVPGDA